MIILPKNYLHISAMIHQNAHRLYEDGQNPYREIIISL